MHVAWVREVWLWRAILVTHKLGDFANTVRSVVEEEEGVVVLDPALVTANNDWLQELVSLALFVSFLDHLDWVVRVLSFSGDDTLHTNLDTVPTLVSVHDVVTTDDCCNLTASSLLAMLEESLHVTGSRLGVSVATISEKVNVDFWDLELVGDIEKVEKVVDVRVL